MRVHRKRLISGLWRMSQVPPHVPVNVGVLVAAAGTGERVGGRAKQFRPIAGVPMLLRALRPFAQHPRVRQLVVALPPDVVRSPPTWLQELHGERLRLTAGGASRAESVLAALNALEPTCEIVLVHDAARPFVSRETIDNVVDAASDGGAVPAVPVSDTIKRAEAGTGLVLETVDRSSLWQAQTPQGFPRVMLEKAYAAAPEGELSQFTDESGLVEAAGFPVRVVPSSGHNIKITTAHDFAIAEALARS